VSRARLVKIAASSEAVIQLLYRPGHFVLTQDLIFAIDQLVEIAIRALSPAVNDTFTALTCIDWLGDALCKISTRVVPLGQHRDDFGYLRLIAPVPSYRRIVDGAYSKIRQAGRGMPAVNIRQLDSLARAAQYTSDDAQRDALRRQADMILRSANEAVTEVDDRTDIHMRYAHVLRALEVVAKTPAPR
jgi:uncharacterized membrane protein